MSPVNETGNIMSTLPPLPLSERSISACVGVIVEDMAGLT